MMRILALSTAEQGADMALFEGTEPVCRFYWAGPKSHSRRLMSMVEQVVVERAGLNIGDIDGFIAAKGPGSFTGVRIGISGVKGLAAAVEKPCAGVSSLDGIALRFSACGGPVCVMMDARRNEVYTALYRFDKGRIAKKSRERVCPPEQAVAGAGSGALFAGSGSKAYLALIREMAGPDAWVSDAHMDHVSAAALVVPALQSDGFFQNTENALVPTYLRKSDAEMLHSKPSALKQQS